MSADSIRDNIESGVYKLVACESKKSSGKHWITIKCVTDENGQIIKHTYACSMSNCKEVFLVNLKTDGTGKLNRHYKKCNHNQRNSIDEYFDKEYRPPPAKRVKTNHKTNVNDAVVAFIVKDLRPVDAVGKPGMLNLLSVFTLIGSVYGAMKPEDVDNMLPSRFSVSSL